MSTENSIEALVSLGFTRLEAEVYTFLVRESPVTGYRVAQAIGKPAANVYKAIESLQNKGAVLVDEGANRICRALPADELLSQLERGFQSRRLIATEALAELKGSAEDDRVYQLRSREQVIERGRSMLARCKRLALLDAFPDPLEALRPDIEATAARGVQVTLKVFQPTEVPGAEVVLNPRGQDVMGQYPGQWLILIVDGAELLLASLMSDGKGIHQAIWSGSVTLSYMFNCSFAAEIMMCGIFNHIGAGAPADELEKAVLPFIRKDAKFDKESSTPIVQAMQRYGRFFGKNVPGYVELLDRFGPPNSHKNGED